MLSPLREPVFATSARTFSGALSEMERLIGDALFSGYIGYNGRAPGGVPPKKEEASDGTERNKSGGDARHTLVAYFEIVELASILGVDKETINLAVRIFRHTASNTSLRNRNVECLATAAFVAAAERRWFEYEMWQKRNDRKAPQESLEPSGPEAESIAHARNNLDTKLENGDFDEMQDRNSDILLGETITEEKVSLALSLDKDDEPGNPGYEDMTDAGADNDKTQAGNGTMKEEPMESEATEKDSRANPIDEKELESWAIPPRHLSLEEISSAANLDVNEVTRYLKVVRIALRKQRPESSSSVTAHMPLFCRRLDLSGRTQRLAIGIAENAMRNNICSRRNPVSISAAAIYLACQMDGVRKTQTEICRATNLTEVTLRKVYKELNREHAAVIPSWYKSEEKSAGKEVLSEGLGARPSQGGSKVSKAEKREESVQPNAPGSLKDKEPEPENKAKCDPELLVPPPLPPGFGELPSKPLEADVSKPPPPPPLPPKQEPATRSALPPSSSSLMAMMGNPAMQAFANAFSMMPQIMMPPPPPPLPPARTNPTTEATDKDAQAKCTKEQDVGSTLSAKVETHSKAAGSTKSRSRDTDSRNAGPPNSARSQSSESPLSAMRTVLTAAQGKSSTGLPQNTQQVMASMQSMFGMMQAMQAFQAIHKKDAEGAAAEQPDSGSNPWAFMASMMQSRTAGTGGFGDPGVENAPLNDRADAGNMSAEEKSGNPGHPKPTGKSSETASESEPNDT